MPTPPRLAPRSRSVKSLRIMAHFCQATFLAKVRFPGLTKEQTLQAIQRWARQVLSSLEIDVQTNRLPLENFSGLVVSNHLSWLDILVLQSLIPGIFVAKKEVRNWAVLGYLAQASATIFVDRSSPRSARLMVDRTTDAIQQGYAVVVFPEGTSSDGSDLGNFHANIFESAIRAGSAVQLLTLEYIDTATGNAAGDAHYIGDMNFVSSLWRILRHSSIAARVHVGECIAADGHSRKTLALHAHGKIRAHLTTQIQESPSPATADPQRPSAAS